MRYLCAIVALGWAGICNAQTPNNIEAVEYDPVGNRWFVSNGSSLLVTENQGGDWQFFGDAQASHGMEVLNGVLYAIGNNVIRAYDLNSAEELGSISIPGVGFLNGMGSHSNGTLVVGDFSSGRIYAVDVTAPDDMTHNLLAANFGGTPNGIVVDEANSRAVVVCWGSNADVLSVDMESGEVTPLVDGTGMDNLDGVDMDGEGRFYVSSWSPTRVTRYSADFSNAETVLTSSAGLSSPADISYAVEIDTLGIANSGTDNVTFHGFEASTVEMPIGLDWSVDLRAGSLYVTLPYSECVAVTIMDATGRQVWKREEHLPSGRTLFPLPHVPAAGLISIHCDGVTKVVR